MNTAPLLKPLRIGWEGDEDYAAMTCSDQRMVDFYVSFEEISAPVPSRDYRPLLAALWSSFLTAAGLSAAIGHVGLHPTKGPSRQLAGWVWRQEGRERLGSVSEAEMIALGDALRVPGSTLRAFALRELITTGRYGRNLKKRLFRLKDGVYSVEGPD